MLLEGRANPRLQDRRGQDALMKLIRRDITGPAAGCAWSWEVQQKQKLPGPSLPISDVTDIESAKVACEAESACVGFCLSVSGNLSFHGAACTSEPAVALKPQTQAEGDLLNDE